MKKIAVLILCHKNAQQVNLFVNQFDENLYDIYLHCDTKMIDDIEIINKSNVYICKKRINAKRAHISMVLAELELLSLANKKEYMYYLFVSGQDLLIKPSKIAYDFLNEHYGNNYFKIVKDDIGKFLKHNETYYPKLLFNNTFLIKVIRNFYLILTGGRRHTFKIFTRKFSTKYEFSFSSEFFSITKEAVNIVFDFLRENPTYIKEISKSICPDECFLVR